MYPSILDIFILSVIKKFIVSYVKYIQFCVHILELSTYKKILCPYFGIIHLQKSSFTSESLAFL